MKISSDDLKQLRAPLALAAVLFALGAACLVSSNYYLDAAKKTQDATRLSRVASQERVLRVSEEEREIRNNLIFYEQMRERGIVSEQNRIDWIETIARIKRNRKLFEIKYRIEAQRGLDYAGISATGTGDFTVSRMKLDMLLLLHENDLLDFLADLQGRAERIRIGAPMHGDADRPRGTVSPNRAAYRACGPSARSTWYQ